MVSCKLLLFLCFISVVMGSEVFKPVKPEVKKPEVKPVDDGVKDQGVKPQLKSKRPKKRPGLPWCPPNAKEGPGTIAVLTWNIGGWKDVTKLDNKGKMSAISDVFFAMCARYAPLVKAPSGCKPAVVALSLQESTGSADTDIFDTVMRMHSYVRPPSLNNKNPCQQGTGVVGGGIGSMTGRYTCALIYVQAQYADYFVLKYTRKHVHSSAGVTQHKEAAKGFIFVSVIVRKIGFPDFEFAGAHFAPHTDTAGVKRRDATFKKLATVVKGGLYKAAVAGGDWNTRYHRFGAKGKQVVYGLPLKTGKENKWKKPNAGGPSANIDPSKVKDYADMVFNDETATYDDLSLFLGNSKYAHYKPISTQYFQANGWGEGAFGSGFRPSYKIDPLNGNGYNLAQIPAWTDRIITTDGFRKLFMEITGSYEAIGDVKSGTDHLPVHHLFVLKAPVKDPPLKKPTVQGQNKKVVMLSKRPKKKQKDVQGAVPNKEVGPKKGGPDEAEQMVKESGPGEEMVGGPLRAGEMVNGEPDDGGDEADWRRAEQSASSARAVGLVEAIGLGLAIAVGAGIAWNCCRGKEAEEKKVLLESFLY